MAVGFNGSGDYAKLTSNLPSLQTFTLAARVKLRATPAGWAYFLCLEDADASATAWALIGYSDDDNAWEINATVGKSNWSVPNQPANDTWYYFFIRSNATANNVEAGYVTEDGGAFVKPPAAVNANAFTVARLSIGNDSYDEWVDLVVEEVRCWDAELTDSELLIERNSDTPVITANLRGDWPMADNSDTGDDSGNGYTLTFGGTLTSETGSGWGGSASVVPVIIKQFRERWS